MGQNITKQSEELPDETEKLRGGNLPQSSPWVPRARPTHCGKQPKGQSGMGIFSWKDMLRSRGDMRARDSASLGLTGPLQLAHVPSLVGFVSFLIHEEVESCATLWMA